MRRRPLLILMHSFCNLGLLSGTFFPGLGFRCWDGLSWHKHQNNLISI